MNDKEILNLLVDRIRMSQAANATMLQIRSNENRIRNLQQEIFTLSVRYDEECLDLQNFDIKLLNKVTESQEK